MLGVTILYSKEALQAVSIFLTGQQCSKIDLASPANKKFHEFSSNHFDKNIVFYENFEDSNYYKKWIERDGRPVGIGTVPDQQGYVYGGKKSAIVMNRRGKHGADGDGKYVPKVPLDKVSFVRLFLRLSDHFSMGSANAIKFFSIVGTKRHTYYKGAGHRPTGYDRFGASLVMDSWNEISIYCYHMDQRSGYGDQFYTTKFNSNSKLKTGQWYCLEMMLKSNDPGLKNGELKAWINDELIIEVTKLRFRETDQLKMWRFYTPFYFGGGGIRNTSPKEQAIYIDGFLEKFNSTIWPNFSY